MCYLQTLCTYSLGGHSQYFGVSCAKLSGFNFIELHDYNVTRRRTMYQFYKHLDEKVLQRCLQNVAYISTILLLAYICN
jgi:hypothetical protein